MFTGISNVSTIRDALGNSAFEFTLTGSRFFGNARPDSDWDFFTQDCKQVREFLTTLGFEQLKFTDYNDRMTSSVYRHRGESIDIQCVKDAVIKKQAQQWMLNAVKNMHVWGEMYLNLDKYKKDLLWDFAMCAATGVPFGVGHSYAPYGPETIREACAEGLKDWSANKISSTILTEGEINHLKNKNRILAIKSYRERNPSDLGTAKRAVEDEAVRLGLAHYKSDWGTGTVQFMWGPKPC